MSQSAVVDQLSTAFEPYLRSPDQLHHIRLEIAKHVESLKPQDNLEFNQHNKPSIPTYVTGHRRKYLEALLANIEARQHHAKLRAQLKSEVVLDTSTSCSVQALQTHAEVLRLRKQYEKYQILSYYATGAENLAVQNHIYDTQPLITPASSDTPKSSADSQSGLSARVQELTRNLEVAVLQANHQLKRERQRLDEAKSLRSATEAPSNEAKLRALVATSVELTSWIEESLARCDVEHATGDAGLGNTSGDQQEAPNYARAIDERYEQYLESRKRLLQAVSDLSTLQPTASSTRPTLVQSSSQASKLPLAIPRSTATTSTLPYLESHHLPLLDQKRTLSQSQTHIDDVLSQHSQMLSEQLLRLSDESHLLPSYPILVKSRKTDQNVDSTERLLHAWKFAMDAAGTATSAAVQKHTRLGEAAVHEVNAVLDEQNQIDELWARLEMD